jgi:hypothetical protein
MLNLSQSDKQYFLYVEGIVPGSSLILTDISGRIIEIKQDAAVTETFNLEKLPSAVYMLQVKNNRTVYNFRIVKK